MKDRVFQSNFEKSPDTGYIVSNAEDWTVAVSKGTVGLKCDRSLPSPPPNCRATVFTLGAKLYSQEDPKEKL